MSSGQNGESGVVGSPWLIIAPLLLREGSRGHCGMLGGDRGEGNHESQPVSLRVLGLSCQPRAKTSPWLRGATVSAVPSSLPWVRGFGICHPKICRFGIDYFELKTLAISQGGARFSLHSLLCLMTVPKRNSGVTNPSLRE